MPTRPITGDTLARKALAALRDPRFEKQAGYCQKFCRQVVQSVFGAKFDQYWAPSAYETMHNFWHTPYCVWKRGDEAHPVIQAGDLLYKGVLTSGAHGHVGIAANGKLVGRSSSQIIVFENSSYHINPEHEGNVSGAKGWRTLEAYGRFEAIVRLT
jgi:hypothetical protein